MNPWCPPSADQEFLPLGDLIREHVVPLRQAGRGVVATLRELQNDTEAGIEAMNLHCQQCAEEIRDGTFDVLFANSCLSFRVTAIGRFVDIPSLLYLQEPYRWLYEALPRPPWAADERMAGWWHEPRPLVHALKRAVVGRRNQVLIREEARNARAFDIIACNSAIFSRVNIACVRGQF